MKDINEMLNTVICGDSIETMARMEDKSFDLIVTDIPYNEVNRKTNGLRVLDKEDADVLNYPLRRLTLDMARLTKGSIYVWCGTEQVSEIRKTLVEEGFSTRLLIWEKTNPSPMNGEKIWLSGIECCVYGKLPNATYNGFCKNTVLRFPSGESKIHPTQKPIELFKTFIDISSNEGDIVLDPFLGSGTTAVACKQLGRKYIGIELSQKYCDIANERLKQDLLF